jgi:hypothetical protein
MQIYSTDGNYIADAEEVTVMFQDGKMSTFKNDFDKIVINEDTTLCYTIKTKNKNVDSSVLDKLYNENK